MQGRGLSVAALLVTFCAGGFAAGPGATSANFLKIPVGARQTAAGAAALAVADDPTAVYYNPAGLAQLGSPQFTLSHNQYVEEITQQWFSAAVPLGFGTLGAGLNYLSVPPFPSYSAADARTGSVSAYDMAASLSFAASRPLATEYFGSALAGVTARRVTQVLDSESASGYGFDAGLLLLPYGRGLSLAAAAENIYSTELKFIDEGFSQARTFKLGAAYRLPPSAGGETLLSLAWGFPDDGPGYAAAGFEKNLAGLFALRAGFNTFGDAAQGLTLGFGLKLPAFSGGAMDVDYAYGATYDLGAVHKVGLVYRFGPALRKAGQRPNPFETEKLSEPHEIPESCYRDTLRFGKQQEKLAVLRELGAARWAKSRELLLPLLRSGDPALRKAAAAAARNAAAGASPAERAEIAGALLAAEEAR